MSKDQGLSSPGAPSAPLSPVLNPSLGGARLRNCPTPNLDKVTSVFSVS